MNDASERHRVTRVRHETRRRTITVTAIEHLSPHMLRIRFASPDLADFESAAPDDHVKLFVPVDGGELAMRDYTPRWFDTATQTLTIDFALHEAGPATRWAMAAAVGDGVQIGGPRGSATITDDFDWYLLVGDETAIPAIARRIEELRAEVPVIAVIAVDGVADQQAMPARDGLRLIWSPRDGSTDDDAARLRNAIAATRLPTGEGYVWIAAEAGVARSLRAYVLDELGHPKAWTKASGYWTAGAADTHVSFED